MAIATLEISVFARSCYILYPSTPLVEPLNELFAEANFPSGIGKPRFLCLPTGHTSSFQPVQVVIRQRSLVVCDKSQRMDVHKDYGLARCNITNSRPLFSVLTTPARLWLSDCPNAILMKIAQVNRPREATSMIYCCSHEPTLHTAGQRINIVDEQTVSHLAVIGKDSEILGKGAE